VQTAGVRGLPMTPAGWFSLCAARYFETYGASRQDLARIAVKNHHNGTLAPKSMLKKEITVEEALNAPIISWPFGLYDCCAQSDGAAVAIITKRELARSFRDDYVLVGTFDMTERQAGIDRAKAFASIAPDAAAEDAGDDRGDVEAAARRGRAARQHAEDLAAEGAADEAGDGVAQRAQALLLQEAARRVSAEGAGNELDDQDRQVHLASAFPIGRRPNAEPFTFCLPGAAG